MFSFSSKYDNLFKFVLEKVQRYFKSHFIRIIWRKAYKNCVTATNEEIFMKKKIIKNNSKIIAPHRLLSDQ